jgi:excisionase family DNA binding protein
MASADDPKLLRPAEVAAMFGVNAKTVARWAKEGRIRCIRTPGGHMRIYADDIRALLVRDVALRAASDLPAGVRTPQS